MLTRVSFPFPFEKEMLALSCDLASIAEPSQMNLGERKIFDKYDFCATKQTAQGSSIGPLKSCTVQIL